MNDAPVEQASMALNRRLFWQQLRIGLRFVGGLIAWVIWMLVACGLFLRFTIRDQVYPWALVYYTTPIPAMAIWMFVASAVSAKWPFWRQHRESTSMRSRWTQSRLSMLAGLGFACWTLSAECDFRARPTVPADIRVVFWNVAHVATGIDRIGSRLRDLDAAVIGLVEADHEYQIDLDQWQRQLPDHEVVRTVFGSLVAVKGRVVSHQIHDLAMHSYCEEFQVRVDDREFSVLLVDVASDLKRSRRRPLHELARVADLLNDRPVVIMGDFNTPDDSAWLEPLRRQHQQAFRHHGSGYAATWPSPLPVLTIDQIWTNQRVQVSRCQNEWTLLSDHRPVVCLMSLRP